MPEPIVLEHRPLEAVVRCDPFALEIRRGGRRLIRGIGLWAAAGESRDQFIQLTEGVIAAEELERPRRLGEVREAKAGEASATAAGEAATSQTRSRNSISLRADLGAIRLALHPERLVLDFTAAAPFFRAGAEWDARPGERFTGLGARHRERLDQTGRRIRLGADRRYTGPDCPPDMLEVGGIPQGDYAPVPWLLASRGYALWIETDGDGVELDLAHRISVSTRTAAGPFRLHVLTDPTPAARLRRFLRLTNGLPALLPEWAYGHWKSRDVYEHQRDVEHDFDGYRDNRLPSTRSSSTPPGDPIQRVGAEPLLWVAPVLEDGAREREVSLPRGDWIDLWSGERHPGGGELLTAAPLERIPAYVRRGSILVTHPAEHVARGLGDVPERERPLEATLYGEPWGGRAGVRLADGTRIRWREGAWSVEPERKIRFSTAPLP